MEFQHLCPIWDKLTPTQRQLVSSSIVPKTLGKGAVLHDGSADCAGLVLIKSGQLRAYILSEDGREITLYRLLDQDICLFSASCVMRSVQFEIMIAAEKESEVFILPPYIFKKIMEESAPLANYVNELMATRFSEVMWLIEQIMWKSVDKRLANFLLDEAALEDSDVLKLTHEAIANHLGTAREVVTRMLRYFQNEGYVKLTRGTVELTDRKGMEDLIES
ncbi:MAG: Crp/Fnr family transcriptional regulator [Ruminococcaceae bacterium]|nr:Crp/Fnr family transcriptional regulator [Oscillospiraceae bacterium]